MFEELILFLGGWVIGFWVGKIWGKVISPLVEKNILVIALDEEVDMEKVREMILKGKGDGKDLKNQN